MLLDALLPRILPNCRLCPDSVALLHLRDAAIEFCERTLTWTEELAEVSSIIGTTSYAIPLPVGSALVKVMEFKVDGEAGNVVTPDHGRDLLLNDSSADTAWTEDRKNFRVTPAPVLAGTKYVLRVALKPTQAATTISDDMGEHYARHLALGALANLYAMEDVPWARPDLAADKRAQFESLIDNTASRALKGFGRGRHRVKARFF